MKLLRPGEEPLGPLTDAEVSAAAWWALEESDADRRPHPDLEEWEALYLGSASLSDERCEELNSHLAACDRCHVEYRELIAFLAPVSSGRPLRSFAKAAVIALVGGLVLWAGVGRNPTQFSAATAATAPDPTKLWLYPAGPTRSADPRRPLELTLSQDQRLFDVKLRLDEERHGLFRVVLWRESEGAKIRRWVSPGLPVIDSADLVLRIPTQVFEGDGSFLIELRKLEGVLVDVYPLKVVELPE